jgi:hypothetical protein
MEVVMAALRSWWIRWMWYIRRSRNAVEVTNISSQDMVDTLISTSGRFYPTSLVWYGWVVNLFFTGAAFAAESWTREQP